jgi:hypothetical protein
MYLAAGPTRKISKPWGAEIRRIHRRLPVLLLFFWQKAMTMDPDKDTVRIWENEL